MGKIKPYVDVRSAKDVPQFESLLKTGNVYVLVYADWCGHCTRFKQNMWDEVAKSPNKTVNTAAVHYDMVDKTSMKNTTIEGYPTLFEVSNTSKTNNTKVISTPQTKEELISLVNSDPTTEEVSENIYSMNKNNIRSKGMTNNSARASSDTFDPAPMDTLPPDSSLDSLTSEDPNEASVQKGGQRAGSLMETLLKVTANTAHVALLAASASELSHRYRKHKKTRRVKRQAKKKTLKRK